MKSYDPLCNGYGLACFVFRGDRSRMDDVHSHCFRSENSDVFATSTSNGGRFDFEWDLAGRTFRMEYRVP